VGAPGLPDEPFADRAAEVAQDGRLADGNQAALQQAIVALVEKLKQTPSDAPVWLLYGRTLAMLSQWDQAEDAYRRAMDLGQTDPDVGAAHAEMIVMQAGGTVTPVAEMAFRQVLKDDPASGIARYYLAMALAQGGEPRKALDGFEALLAELPPDSPLRDQVGEMITEAARAAGVKVPDPFVRAAAQAPGPDAAAVAEAASMTDEQRQAMVRGVVGKLEAKLQAEPANLDGWLRLAQAYAVLHDPDRAADAYDKAARLRPGDVSIPLQEVRMLLNETDKLPPRVKDLLRQAEVTAPEQPLVLWYLGMAAAREANADEARRYWGMLLAKLPTGGDNAKTIRDAIGTLKKYQDSHVMN
jgi:cytochrome c-type biogenesis protein CcmH